MTTNLHKQLTLVIPTHNRPAFLRRLFHYLELVQDGSQILIVDSSSPENRSQNEASVQASSRSLHIAYRHINAGIISKCRQAMEEEVATPFCVFCADDDFLMPDAVIGAMEFLQQNRGYSCAQGVMVSLCTGKSNKCYALPCYSIEQREPVRRFQAMASNWYSTFYSVYHTSLLRRAWQFTDDNTDCDRARIFPEILLSQLSVTQGRVKFLPGLYNLREEHDLNESLVVPEVVDQRASRDLYEQFRDGLASELAQASRVTHQEAAILVEQYYGRLRDGCDQFAKRRRGPFARLRKSLRRAGLSVLDRMDQRSIRVRRRLDTRLANSGNADWQTAMQLMVQYPQGMMTDAAGIIRAA